MIFVREAISLVTFGFRPTRYWPESPSRIKNTKLPKIANDLHVNYGNSYYISL